MATWGEVTIESSWELRGRAGEGPGAHWGRAVKSKGESRRKELTENDTFESACSLEKRVLNWKIISRCSLSPSHIICSFLSSPPHSLFTFRFRESTPHTHTHSNAWRGKMIFIAITLSTARCSARRRSLYYNYVTMFH